MGTKSGRRDAPVLGLETPQPDLAVVQRRLVCENSVGQFRMSGANLQFCTPSVSISFDMTEVVVGGCVERRCLAWKRSERALAVPATWPIPYGLASDHAPWQSRASLKGGVGGLLSCSLARLQMNDQGPGLSCSAPYPIDPKRRPCRTLSSAALPWAGRAETRSNNSLRDKQTFLEWMDSFEASTERRVWKSTTRRTQHPAPFGQRPSHHVE